MVEKDNQVFESPPSQPDDDFWLEQGRRMLADSLATLRITAAAMITATGFLQAIYLGILGFARPIPSSLIGYQKILFIFPLLIWIAALYLFLSVMMTKKFAIYQNSPDDIREKTISLMLEKQRQVQWGFWLLVIGTISAFLISR